MKQIQNILFIFDDSINIGNFKRNSVIFDKAHIFVISLTHSSSLTERVCKILFDVNKDNRISKIDFEEYFYRNSFSQKEAFIKFIYEFSEKPYFGGKSLKDYLRLPYSDFSFWWFSLNAEKKIEKDYSYRKLIKFLSILEIKTKFSCSKIYLDINDKELVFVLKSNAKRKKYIFRDFRNSKDKMELFYFISFFINGLRYYRHYIKRSFMIKSKVERFEERLRSIKDVTYLLLTYFPSLDRELLKERIFANVHYGPLQNAIETKYKDRHCWLALIPDVNKSDLKKNILLINEINNWGYRIFLWEEFLKIKDLFIIFFQFLYISFKFFIKKNNIKNRFIFPGISVNIWKIFRTEWLTSFCGKHLIEGAAYLRVFKRLCSILKTNVNIIYLLEMQPWEKALNIAISENRGLKSIGIQHTAVPLLDLSYFYDRRELRGRNLIQDMPLPTRLACIGKKDFKILEDSGWDKNLLFIFGAMRFTHFERYLNGYMPWEKRKNNILVALPIMEEETKEILSFVYEAFKDCHSYKVIIKFHPYCSISRAAESLGIDLKGDIFEITDKTLDELMIEAKVMVVGGSSACFEAIACQCPVIIPCLINFIDVNPLSRISTLPMYAINPKELKAMAYKILDSDRSPLSIEECRSFIKDYYVLLDSDGEYLERIEKALISS